MFMERKLIHKILILLAFIPELVYAQNFTEAMAAYNDGKFDKARSQFLALTSAEPSNDAAYYYIGLCDLRLNDAAEAEMFLKKAVELDNSNYWYKINLAELYVGTNRVDKAVAIYEELLESNPKKTDIYYSLVNLYARQNNIQKILEALDEIEAISGKSEQVTLARYDVLMGQNRHEEAFAALQSYNEDFSSATILAAMGDYEMSMDRDSSALRYYDEAMSCEAENLAAILGKAEVFRTSKRYDDYFETINLFIGSENAPAQSKVQYLTALVQRMDADFRDRNIHRVDSLIQSCVRLYPDNYDVRVFYVQFLNFLEDWPELAAQGEECYSIFPEETAFLEMKSLAYYNMKDYQNLLAESERIISIAPDDSAAVLGALTTIGDTYHLLGERKKAYAAYDKALKLNPKYVPVLNNYAYYLSEEGRKLKKAYEMSKITVEAEPDNATYLDTFGWILFLQGKAVEAKPFFKHAMLYGGKESAVILEHYAAVLRALKEDDLAKVYEGMAEKL